MKPLHAIAATALLLTACASCAAPVRVAATPEALAAAMQGSPVVILGEIHDNAFQHALRAAALRKLVEGGARPAIAFEQFDRPMQDAIDAARRARPRDADHLVAKAGGSPSWKWEYYTPFVALALEYDLPIVAANLSRAEAMRVATADAAREALPDALVREHESAVARGHCDLLPAQALPGMARAQIARDRVLAASIAPYATRGGVVLLTGNAHARTDIGVPHWLPEAMRATSKSIALLEALPDVREGSAFYGYVVTAAIDRPDPCAELNRRMKAGK